MALSQLPVSMMEATLFSGIVYFMVGFHMDWAYFLIFWGVVASSNLCLSSLFRWGLTNQSTGKRDLGVVLYIAGFELSCLHV